MLSPSDLAGAASGRADDSATPIDTQLHVELGTPSAPALVRWTSRYSTDQHAFAGRHCYALQTPDGVVLIDPDRVTPAAAAEFGALLDRMSHGSHGRPPVAIVLTNSWHERAAYRFRDRLGVPVWLPAWGTAEMEGRPDHLFRATDALPGGLTAIEIDTTFAGDTVLLAAAPTGERVLFGGDAILGGSGRPGHWRERAGLHLWLYGSPTVEVLRERFAPLRSLAVDLIYSAHGAPVPFRDHPIARLRCVLDEGTLRTGALGSGLSLPGE